MSYLDIGYTDFLAQQDTQNKQQDPLELDYNIPELSGSKIVGGLLTSNDGKTQFNLEQGTFKVSDGAQDRVVLGVLPDGSVGLLIKDINGNILMQISGDIDLIKSADESMSLDFNEAQLIVRNEGKVPVVLIGKQINGFNL